MLSRKLYIVGEINSEAYGRFTKELYTLERQSKKPVYVELASEGGDPYFSLAYAGRMRKSPCDIIITGSGLVASAAVLILACGDKRVMTQESWLMVHEESGEMSGSVHDLEPTVSHFRQMENQCNEILEKVTRTSAVQWAAFHKSTAYFNAKQCLALGIIDEVI